MKRRSRQPLLVLSVLVATAFLLLASAGPALGGPVPTPSISPSSVTAVVFPGQSIQVEKSVQTPVIPPKIDIFLMQDETGSMYDDIAALQALAPDLWDAIAATGTDFTMGVAGFRDFAVAPFGSPGDWVYRLTTDLTTDKTTFVAGVGALTAAGGDDTPEAQLEGVHYAAAPAHAAIDSNPGCGHHRP